MALATDSQTPDHAKGCHQGCQQGCQLVNLYSATTRLTLGYRLRRFVLRMISAVERRLDGVRRGLGQAARPAVVYEISLPSPASSETPEEKAAPETSSGGPFAPGETVQVVSLDEILSSLDDQGRCDGLEFMVGMKSFCGRTMVVKKKVRTMFDERAHRMLKVRRERYILEGSICEGLDSYDREGCDRCCFFFWSDRWLRKLN